MSYHPVSTTLLVFEDNLHLIEGALKQNVIRVADKLQNPYEPLRPGKELTIEGDYIVPNAFTGISLAASLRQLDRVFRIGDKRWLLTVERNSSLPEGFAFREDNLNHWSLIVTCRMHRAEYMEKLSRLILNWRVVGKFIRYE